MPKIRFTDRTINFTQQDFDEALDVKLAIEMLGSIMLYPESLDDSLNYILGSTLHALKVNNATPEQCRKIAIQSPDFLWHIIHRGPLIEKKMMECWRQSGKGHNRFNKGLVVGALTELLYLVGYNMAEVYQFIERNPNLLNRINKNGKLTRFPGRRKSLESIWNTYKHAAHFWWAYNELGKTERIFLFHDIQCANENDAQAAALFKKFLKEATLYRDLLIEKRDPTADENSKKRKDDYQFNDPGKLWLLLYEGKPFQKPYLKKTRGSMPLQQALDREFPYPDAPQQTGPLVQLNPLGGVEINPNHAGTRFFISDGQVFFHRRIS